MNNVTICEILTKEIYKLEDMLSGAIYQSDDDNLIPRFSIR